MTLTTINEPSQTGDSSVSRMRRHADQRVPQFATTDPRVGDLQARLNQAQLGERIVMSDMDQTVLLMSVALDARANAIAQQVRRAHDERLRTDAGRQLFHLFQQSNLTDVHISFRTSIVTDYALARQISSMTQDEHYALEHGWVSNEDLCYLDIAHRRANDRGLFYGHVSVAIVEGCKA